MRRISYLTAAILLLLTDASVCPAAEIEDTEATFVTILQVSGDRITIANRAGGGRRGGAAPQAAGRRGGRGGRAGRGRGAEGQSETVSVSADAKITSAMRERRTFEFRVGVELAGGLRNRIFQDLRQPLSARVLMAGSTIVEINVITSETDINQSNAADGRAVIAVRPKRPPSKPK